jgi:hypothetical protein
MKTGISEPREVTKIVTAHRQREGGGFIVRRPFPSAVDFASSIGSPIAAAPQCLGGSLAEVFAVFDREPACMGEAPL